MHGVGRMQRQVCKIPKYFCSILTLKKLLTIIYSVIGTVMKVASIDTSHTVTTISAIHLWPVSSLPAITVHGVVVTGGKTIKPQLKIGGTSKFKNQPRLLFSPTSIHTCQQKPNPSGDPVPLKNKSLLDNIFVSFLCHVPSLVQVLPC
jgi:hypothetical protein